MTRSGALKRQRTHLQEGDVLMSFIHGEQTESVPRLKTKAISEVYLQKVDKGEEKAGGLGRGDGGERQGISGGAVTLL